MIANQVFFYMQPISKIETIQSITQNCTASSVETGWLLHISSVLQWMNHFEEREQISSPIFFVKLALLVGNHTESAFFLMGSQVANIGQSLYVEFATSTPWREWFRWTDDISSPFSYIMRCMDFMDALFKRITHLTNSACHAGCVSAGNEMMRLILYSRVWIEH